jgi:hypothetical protein
LRQRVKYAKESIFITAYGSGAEQQECIRVMRDLGESLIAPRSSISHVICD